MRQASNRIAELDGLRGIAAMWVVFYHLWGAIQKRDVAWVPEGVDDFFHAGFLGVDIFFILSGFVITYSISSVKITSTFIPRFMIRRSVRIDPPYWGAIFLAILLIFLKNSFFPSHSSETPDFYTLVAHLFYLQDLLGLGNISSVFWTLCLEFQFYLLFSSFYYIYNILDVNKKKFFSNFLIFMAVIFCGLSPFLRFSEFQVPISGTIIPYAYEFILGVLAYHYTKGRFDFFVIAFPIIISSIVTLIFKPVYYATIPAIITLIIMFSGKTEVFSILKSRIMIFLGKISYSLYLTHAIVGWVSISLLSYYLESYSGMGVTISIFFIGIFFSIFFSVFYYYYVERPSIKLSKIFKKHN